MTMNPASPPAPTDGKRTVREAVHDLLRAFGMTTMFGNPGSTELALFIDFPACTRSRRCGAPPS